MRLGLLELCLIDRKNKVVAAVVTSPHRRPAFPQPRGGGSCENVFAANFKTYLFKIVLQQIFI